MTHIPIRKKIYRDDKDFSRYFNLVSQITRWRALNIQDFYFLNYHQKAIKIKPQNFDYNLALKKVKLAIYVNIVRPRIPIKDEYEYSDLIQDCLIEIYLRSGLFKGGDLGAFYYATAKYRLYDHIHPKYRRKTKETKRDYASNSRQGGNMLKKVVEMIGGHLSEMECTPITETNCSLCGRKITEGIQKKDAVSSNFNDWGIFKFDSDHICRYCVVCLSGSSMGGRVGLRNHSWLITENELVKLERNQIQDVVFGSHTEPFVILVTYTNKKHTFFYGEVNEPGDDRLAVGTDKGKIVFAKKAARELSGLCQSLYDAGFSREEIGNCQSIKYNQIEKYGVQEYYRALEMIEKYKSTQTLDFILHILKKEKREEK